MSCKCYCHCPSVVTNKMTPKVTPVYEAGGKVTHQVGECSKWEVRCG